MAGTAKGRLQIYCTTGSYAGNSGEVFISIYKALKLLEAAGYVNEIANNYGYTLPATPGTSLNYGGAEQNAFYVFQVPPYGTRTVSWYLLVQWTVAPTFGNSPGNPGLLEVSTTAGIGIQMAAAVTSAGADSNPWVNAGGGTGKAGSDTKGDPVWDDDGAGGSVYVFPRSNNPGGVHNTSKENCVELLDGVGYTTPFRANIIMDRDSMAMTLDINDGDQPYVIVIGTYVPISGMTQDAPFYMQVMKMGASSTGPAWNVLIGNLTGVGYNGGVVAPLDNTVQGYASTYRDLADGNQIYQPNQQFPAGDRYLEFLIPIYIGDDIPNAGTKPGLIGWMDGDFVRSTSGKAVPMSTFNTLTRFVIGSVNVAYTNWDFPWDGSTSTRDMASTRDGTDF